MVKIQRYIYALLFFFIPWIVNPLGSDLNHYPKWAFAVLCIFIFACVAFKFRDREWEKVAHLRIFSFILLIPVIISLLVNNYFKAQVLHLAPVIISFLFILIFSCYKKSEDLLRISNTALFYSTGILALVNLAYFIFVHKPYIWTMGSPAPLAQLFLIVIAIQIPNLKKLKGLQLILLVLIISSLSITLNRWGIGIATILLVMGGVWFEKGTRIYKRKSLFLLGLIVLTFFLALHWSEAKVSEIKTRPLNLNTVDNSLGTRVRIFETTFHMITMSPWLGYGPGGFEMNYNYFNLGRDNEPYLQKIDRKYAHNYFLHIGAETGVLGLMTFILLLLSAVAQSIKRYRSQYWSNIDESVACILITTLLHAQLDITLNMPIPSCLFWMSLGFSLRPITKNENNERSVLSYWIIMISSAALVIGFSAQAISHHYFIKAEKLSLSGKWQESLSSINIAKKLMFLDPAYHYAEGYYYHKLGDFKTADEKLSKAFSEYPFKQKAAIFYSLNALALLDTTLSQQRLLEAYSWDKSNLEALNLLGAIAMKQGKLTQAESYYKKILKADNNLTAPLYQLAIIQLKKGNTEGAKVLLEELLRKQPGIIPAQKLYERIKGVKKIGD